MGRNSIMGTRKRRNRMKIFLLLLPALLFTIVFVYYPFLKTIVNAFSRVNAKGVVKGFAGLENFRYTY